MRAGCVDFLIKPVAKDDRCGRWRMSRSASTISAGISARLAMQLHQPRRCVNDPQHATDSGDAAGGEHVSMA